MQEIIREQGISAGFNEVLHTALSHPDCGGQAGVWMFNPNIFTDNENISAFIVSEKYVQFDYCRVMAAVLESATLRIHLYKQKKQLGYGNQDVWIMEQI